MTRIWDMKMEDRLRREYPSCTDPVLLANELGVTFIALKTRANRLQVHRRKPWTAEQIVLLRKNYGKRKAPEIAHLIGRSTKQVLHMAWSLGLAYQSRAKVTPEWLTRLGDLNAQGWCDQDVAEELGCNRHTVTRWRKRLKLPSHARGQRFRSKIRDATARQLQEAGLESMGELRKRAHQEFVVRRGWPGDLRIRHVQILDVLATNGGPMTLREIAAACGLPNSPASATTASRNILKSNDPEGSYLAHLTGRKLVTRLFRAHQVIGQGRGRTCDLYMLGPIALEILVERAKMAEEGAHGA